jgi:hypothetical protein
VVDPDRDHGKKRQEHAGSTLTLTV